MHIYIYIYISAPGPCARQGSVPMPCLSLWCSWAVVLIVFKGQDPGTTADPCGTTVAPDFHCFFDIVLALHFLRFWCQLGPNMGPNTTLKFTKNRPKSHPKSIPTCILCFITSLIDFFMIF